MVLHFYFDFGLGGQNSIAKTNYSSRKTVLSEFSLDILTLEYSKPKTVGKETFCVVDTSIACSSAQTAELSSRTSTHYSSQHIMHK